MVSSKGASRQILGLAISGEVEIAATPALWAEYEEQVSSDRFLRLSPLSRAYINDVLDYLAAQVHQVQNSFVWRGILLDEDDAIVVESAYNANVDYLVTHNTDHFSTNANQVSFEILKPADFLSAWRNR